ncbi:MAG: T9SS type A sorting domain-containing protein [Chitinophagales bacterium]|nr:T9SS type A sorting domain-containing protein [Chitinophagales bacterium]
MTKENSTLIKRLAQYSAMVAPTMAIAGLANAQVVYTDVDPDFELTADPGTPQGTVLDLNDDGVADFTLAVFSSTSAGGPGGPLNLAGAAPYSANGNGVMGYTSGGFYYPSALDANTMIDDNADFWSYFGFYGTLVWYYLGGAGTFGQWSNVEDKYMGVRFLDGSSNVHYGWIRMDVEDNSIQITLKDFAYEDTPDKGILAGSTISLGVNTVNLANNFGIFSYERNVFIQAPANLKGSMTVSITDMTGKTLLEQTYTDSNVKIPMKDFASGIYLVKATKDGQEKVRKISIQ